MFKTFKFWKLYELSNNLHKCTDRSDFEFRKWQEKVPPASFSWNRFVKNHFQVLHLEDMKSSFKQTN